MPGWSRRRTSRSGAPDVSCFWGCTGWGFRAGSTPRRRAVLMLASWLSSSAGQVQVFLLGGLVFLVGPFRWGMDERAYQSHKGCR